MANQKLITRRHNKRVHRNLKGLLSKCLRYGKLHGVELAMYIDFQEKGEFVSYESDGYSCHEQIAEKKALPKARNYRPGDVEKVLGLIQTKTASTGAERRQEKLTRAVCTDGILDPHGSISVNKCPDLPEFNISILKKHCN